MPGKKCPGSRVIPKNSMEVQGPEGSLQKEKLRVIHLRSGGENGGVVTRKYREDGECTEFLVVSNNPIKGF